VNAEVEVKALDVVLIELRQLEEAVEPVPEVGGPLL
jgi:hypothetical protein